MTCRAFDEDSLLDSERWLINTDDNLQTIQESHGTQSLKCFWSTVYSLAPTSSNFDRCLRRKLGCPLTLSLGRWSFEIHGDLGLQTSWNPKQFGWYWELCFLKSVNKSVQILTDITTAMYHIHYWGSLFLRCVSRNCLV